MFTSFVYSANVIYSNSTANIMGLASLILQLARNFDCPVLNEKPLAAKTGASSYSNSWEFSLFPVQSLLKRHVWSDSRHPVSEVTIVGSITRLMLDMRIIGSVINESPLFIKFWVCLSEKLHCCTFRALRALKLEKKIAQNSLEKGFIRLSHRSLPFFFND